MSDKMNQILAARGQQYGDYSKQSELSKRLRESLMNHLHEHNEPKERLVRVRPYIAESTNMICHKLARAFNGNTLNIDTWRDIAGYATLVADILERDATPSMPVPAPAAAYVPKAASSKPEKAHYHTSCDCDGPRCEDPHCGDGLCDNSCPMPELGDDEENDRAVQEALDEGDIIFSSPTKAKTRHPQR